MASSDVTARLRFLNEAVHLLAGELPETSRHLRMKYNTLRFDHNLDPADNQREKSCGACGSVISLGSEGKLQREKVPVSAKTRKKKGKDSRKSNRPGAMIYTCNTCSRNTRFPVQSRTKSPRYQEQATSLNASKKTLDVLSLRNPPVQTPSITGVRKKAKSNRKGGLAALLAKQKEPQSSSSGFGLDLMDFMKK